MVFIDVVGEGMGVIGVFMKLLSDSGEFGKYGSFDSGVMNVLFVFGWFGMLLYFVGVVMLFGCMLCVVFKLC